MYGIEDPGDYFPKFIQAQAEGYRSRADEMRRRGRALPGAREVLQALAELPQITQSVLTGKPQPSAVGKLGIYGLTDLLDLDSGAYGTDDSIRANLVGIAQQRASNRYGIRFMPGRLTTGAAHSPRPGNGTPRIVRPVVRCSLGYVRCPVSWV